MNALIPIQQQNGIQSVDARQLHGFLGVGKDFSTWIKDRIAEFDFIEGKDYSPNLGNQKKSDSKRGGDRRTIDYFLTLDMAKELSMVERNERGKQARRYFIECEKSLKAATPTAILSDPAALRGLLTGYVDQVLALKAEMKPQRIKEPVSTSPGKDGTWCVTDIGKRLGISGRDLFVWLRSLEWIRLGDPEERKLVPYRANSEQVEAGFIRERSLYFTDNGVKAERIQIRISTEGYRELNRMMKE